MSGMWTTLLAGVVLSAVGLRMLLPPSRADLRLFGGLALAAGLFVFGRQVLYFEVGDGWSFDFLFWFLATVTFVAAAATVTLRNPVYCAVWFAVTLMGTAGLMLIQGAQFLGVATLAVYAGAILVTFLFVLMLAQPEGHAYFDRVSWEGLLAAVAGSLVVGVVTSILGRVFSALPPERRLHSADELSSGILTTEHVAALGGQLFTRHLVAVEVAGALLLAALVAAVAIVIHGRQTAPREGVAHHE